MNTQIDLETFWHQHINRARESGLGRAAYCREHGLRAHQLAYWQKRLAGVHANPFVRALVVQESESRRGPGARFAFASGVVLEIDVGSDPRWVADIAAAMRG